MHSTHTRLRHAALTACAVVLALLAAGCSKASAGAQTGGCREDGDWSGRAQAAWLRNTVTFRGTDDGGGASHEHASVVVRPPRTGDVRVLCRPLAVQVEFWTLTATPAGTELSSVMRYRLSADGSRTRTVGFPSALASGGDGTCTRVLVAVYAGAPLASGQLPRMTRTLTAESDPEVRFRTDRVGAYRLLPARDPARCGTGLPAATASPGGTTDWDIYHP
jgi:hypothetical protein